MEHIDIELSQNDGSILIFTDEGELIELHVEPSPESVVEAISTRPPASIVVSGESSEGLARSLEELGHQVSVGAPITAHGGEE